MATVAVNIVSRADTSGFARASRAMTKVTAAAALTAPALAGASQAVAVLGTAAAGIGALALPVLGAVAAGFEGIKTAAGVASGSFNDFRSAMSSSFSGMTTGFGQLGGVLTAITPQMQGVGQAITGVFNGMAATIAKNTGGLQTLATKAGEFVTRLGPGLNTIVEKMIQFGASINVDKIFQLFTQLGTLLKPIANLFVQLSAAAGPFGGTLGIIGSIITALTPSLVQIAEVMGPVLATAMTTLAPTIGQVGAAFASVITAVAPFIPVIASLIASLVSGLGPVLPVVIGGMIAFAAVLKVAGAAVGVFKTVTTAISAATKVWAAVQWVMNAALLANPIVLIVVAVIALIAVIVLIATKTQFFQTIWQNMCTIVSAVWSVVWNAIKTVATVVLDAIMVYINMWVTVITTIWNVLVAVATSVWNTIQAVVTGVVNGIVASWNMCQAVVSAVWDAISSAVSTVAGVISGVVTGAVNTVVSIFQTLQGIASGVWSAIQGFIDGVAGAIQNVIGLVSGLIDKLGAVGGAIGGLFSNGGAGFTANMTPPPGLSAGQVHLAAGFPSLAGLGRLGRGGAAIHQAIDNRTIVTVDGSGIADPQQVANAVASSIGRNVRTRGLDFAVRVGGSRG